MDVSVATTGINMSFQKIVLIVAIVILILTLSVIGYMMYTTARNTTFPPLTGSRQCPDEWTFNSSNNCTNTIGSSSSGLNLGSFITDISCVNRGTAISCNSNYMPGWTSGDDCSGGWVQGNTTNGRDVSSCYMLASSALDGNGIKYGTAVYTADISNNEYDISYNLKPSLSDNIQWAKTYGLSWDGYL